MYLLTISEFGLTHLVKMIIASLFLTEKSQNIFQILINLNWSCCGIYSEGGSWSEDGKGKLTGFKPRLKLSSQCAFT